MNKFNGVALQKYNQKRHLKALKEFKLPQEQAKFTALPIETLDVTDGQYPIVILRHEKNDPPTKASDKRKRCLKKERKPKRNPLFFPQSRSIIEHLRVPRVARLIE